MYIQWKFKESALPEVFSDPGVNAQKSFVSQVESCVVHSPAFLCLLFITSLLRIIREGWNCRELQPNLLFNQWGPQGSKTGRGLSSFSRAGSGGPVHWTPQGGDSQASMAQMASHEISACALQTWALLRSKISFLPSLHPPSPPFLLLVKPEASALLEAHIARAVPAPTRHSQDAFHSTVYWWGAFAARSPLDSQWGEKTENTLNCLSLEDMRKGRWETSVMTNIVESW